MLDQLSPQEREKEFFNFCISEYLKYGSVDEVFKRHDYSLPISYAGFHRLVANHGIVKAVGPNSKLSEAITFLTCLSEQKIPLEKLYRKMPPSFKTSMSTMHRILHNIKEGIVRRYGTALIISSYADENSILVANDISTPRLELGKPFGSISLPMGYSKDEESATDSILRVLQQEVFTNEAIKGNVPQVYTNEMTPFMFINIADVQVKVFHLTLPENLSNGKAFSSLKLENHRFENINNIISGIESGEYRSGVPEIAAGYQEYRYRLLTEDFQTIYADSIINQKLVNLALDYDVL